MVSKEKKLDTFQKELSRNWGWLLGLGILFIILGLLGLGMVVGLTLMSILFIGILMMIAGVSQLIDTSRCYNWKGVFWHALVGILYIATGAIVIYDPIMASTILTAIIAWILIAIGLIRLLMAFVLRACAGWGWIAVGGVASLILGSLILLQWPYSGLWVLGLFIAVEMIINGWTYVFIALGLRSRVDLTKM